MSIYKNEIGYSLEELKSVLRILESELRKKNLEKDKLRDLLLNIGGLIASLRVLIDGYKKEMDYLAMSKLSNLTSQNLQESEKGGQINFSLKDLFDIFRYPSFPIDQLDMLEYYISNLHILFLHASDKLSDEYYREKLYNVVVKVRAIVDQVSMMIGNEITVLSRLGGLVPFIALKGFGENWIVAVSYLQSLEIAINKSIKRLGIELKGSFGFKDKFKLVFNKLEEDSKDIARLEEKLPPIFWELRNKVVHSGYEPNEKELNTIITWTIQLLQRLEK